MESPKRGRGFEKDDHELGLKQTEWKRVSIEKLHVEKWSWGEKWKHEEIFDHIPHLMELQTECTLTQYSLHAQNY